MINFGILSTAKIAHNFVKGVASSTKLRVTAVASRDLARARTFCELAGLSKAYGSYESLLADPGIDAVYNALPNSLHAEWTIKSLAAGKHVLCEKPLALSAPEALSMFAAADAAQRHLVEAFPYRSQPLTLKLADLLASGEMGRPRILQANFGFTMTDSANIRLSAKLGGGALLDAGSYPVSLARMVAGECAKRVSATAQWYTPGVDETMAATLEFPSGLLAQVSCTFGTGVHRHAVIACDSGVIETRYANHTDRGSPGVFWVRRGISWDAPLEMIEFPPLNGFLAEADTFADLIEGRTKVWSGISRAESIDVARIVDAIRESARTELPVRL